MYSIIWNRKTIENKINNQRLKGKGRGDSKKKNPGKSHILGQTPLLHTNT